GTVRRPHDAVLPGPDPLAGPLVLGAGHPAPAPRVLPPHRPSDALRGDRGRPEPDELPQLPAARARGRPRGRLAQLQPAAEALPEAPPAVSRVVAPDSPSVRA